MQEFRDSVIWDHLLDDLTNHLNHHSSSEEVSTIKKKPKKLENNKMNFQSESDFIQQAFQGGGGGRISRSNSANQLAKSASTDSQKVRQKIMTFKVNKSSFGNFSHV